MTEDGIKIIEFIKEIRKFSEELTLLLKNVESLMNEDGWITATRNTTYASSSNSLQEPKKWYPFDLFRFYLNQKYPLILAFVSIILDESMDERSKTPITEPLVTTGYFVFKNKEDNILNGNYRWARWYELIENRIDDGRIYGKDWGENGDDEPQITQKQWEQFYQLWDDTLYSEYNSKVAQKHLEDCGIALDLSAIKGDGDEYADIVLKVVKAMGPNRGEEDSHFQSYKCFGYPLISITTPAEIESKIVKPLIDILPK